MNHFSFFSSLLFCSFSRTTEENNLFVLEYFQSSRPAGGQRLSSWVASVLVARFFAAFAFVQGASAACANAAYAPQRPGTVELTWTMLAGPGVFSLFFFSSAFGLGCALFYRRPFPYGFSLSCGSWWVGAEPVVSIDSISDRSHSSSFLDVYKSFLTSGYQVKLRVSGQNQANLLFLPFRPTAGDTQKRDSLIVKGHVATVE